MSFQTLFEHFFLETAEVGLGLLEKPDWVQGWTGSDLNWTGSSVKPQFLVTRRSPTGTPHSLWGLQMASWENWQKPTKGKNPYQSQLAQISVVSAQDGKVKFHVIPSFLNPDWQENTVINPWFPRDIYCLLVCLNLCPENLA